MSRKLFAFLISELQTIRVICQKCGTVTETPIKRVATGSGLMCPTCNTAVMTSGSNGSALMRLAEAIGEIQAQSQSVDVEFILPDTSS